MLVYNGRNYVPLSVCLKHPQIRATIQRLGLKLVGYSRFHEVYPRDIPKVQGLPLPALRILESQEVTEPEKPFLARYMNRNHHRKDFRNVYQSDYNKAQLSFDWDA